MRLLVSDLVSPSYFTATAAVELGFFKAEGVDAEIVPGARLPSHSLRGGGVDFVAGSAYSPLQEFPDWSGSKVLCALAHYTYWFLVMRSDLGAKRGDVHAVKGLRIGTSDSVGKGLRRLLAESGIDIERDNVQIGPIPVAVADPAVRSGIGAQAIKEGSIDGFWANGMRAEMAVREGVGMILLDVRRGDGPPGARHYTFPALITTNRLIEENPEAAAGAVRAVVKAQKALKADPSLATQVGRRLFPPAEAEIIAELIERDAPFYDPSISEEAVVRLNQFAQDVGLLTGPIPYERVVSTQFVHLWKE